MALTDLNTWNKSELSELYKKLDAKYTEVKGRNLSLDMSRGKPSAEQLDLSMGLLDILNSDSPIHVEESIDARNYGSVDGLIETKKLFGQILDVNQHEIIVGGNSSLTIMHDAVSRSLLLGTVDSTTPWGKLPKVKFLCPSPGYDRHFAICELLGIEMVTVDMLEDGPDMDTVEELVKNDEAIKGIWCVPKYSNPEGITYSDEVVDRLAKMETKANDFRIFWDDAYTVHHLTDEPDVLKNILTACKDANHPNRVFIFASTSKVTFPGSGISVLASSEENINFIKKQIATQTIGPDKLNQLRHVHFLKDLETIKQHMKKHAEIIKPKFDMVLEVLEKQLGKQNIASWNEPNGGYFISLNTLDGCATEVVKLASEAGVKLTPAGATFPYGKDPSDRNIRIAPTFPTLNELQTAIEVLCLCIQLVSTNKLLQNQ
ncbi:aminotransferase class I/II-fold pyridoxal phosphate-dependent enzyme [Aquibacillus sp. LR5S19]|uniref:Aminotransferase class I/II-fold pyridoxal phosphate-dependent enzyme n=1 Tax=Aquibacillus rhizosphaerae TaxID=3051431 RepID=A0ABT7LB46_9BACI|nr:aminotransferase class I/II-fold pyridoxal phosphate-dependent enzyme [Aquibacillus sp. LR5S19]MDL4841780.1 aminotransferase class I/II-fold pyridoxal phosphate-dependent enzyme [Aquibacillus sp. LR5S19]